jgi:iron complex outermembrane receptor protein
MRHVVRAAALCGSSFVALVAASAAVAGGAPGAAPAASSPPDAGAVTEIVVTARQRSENLKDVPAAISVLTASTLRAAGVTRPEGVVALTPGVAMVNGASEQGDTQINIRGVNGTRDADPSFAFVLDGIQEANPAAFNREFTDLQQIEVVKGPQGAVYGRNATAGAIIVTTKKPSSHLTGLLEGSAGDYGSYTAKGMLSGPITDKVGATLSADYRKTDGQYGNSLFSGQNNLDSYEGGTVNLRVFADIDANTTFDLKGRYSSLQAGSLNYIAAFGLQKAATAFGNPNLYQDVNHLNYIYQNNVPHTNHQTAGEISAKFDHDFGWAKLTAWTLYSDFRDDMLADGTSASFGFFNNEPHCRASTAQLYAQGVTLPPPQYLLATPEASFFGPYSPTTCDGYQYQRRDQSDETVEVRLTSRSDQSLRWLAGAYYLHVDRQVGVATGIDAGGAPPRSLYVPSSSPYSTEELLWDNFRSNVAAVFGQVQYDILHNLEGSVAMRYDSEQRSDHNLVPVNAVTKYIDYTGAPYVGGAPLNPGLDPTLNPGGIKDQSKTFSQLQPKLGLRWTIDPSWTVYGDWGIGFKSGGFNNAGSKATIDAFINPPRIDAGFAPVNIQDDYKKEVSSEFELGAKGRLLDGRLTVDAALYENEVRNMQFFEFYVGPFGLLRVVSNIDRVQLYGAELGLHYKATDYLSFDASGSYTHSRIEKNSVRPDTVGNESPYTPLYTWNLAAQYDRPIGDSGLKFHGRVDVRGVGPTWFHVVQNQDNPTIFELGALGPYGRANFAHTQRAAYETVDLRLGLEWKQWTVTAFGTNILDKRYVAEVIPAPEFGGSFVSPGQGSRFGADVTYKF